MLAAWVSILLFDYFRLKKWVEWPKLLHQECQSCVLKSVLPEDKHALIQAKVVHIVFSIFIPLEIIILYILLAYEYEALFLFSYVMNCRSDDMNSLNLFLIQR